MKDSGCACRLEGGKWYFYCYSLRGKPCDFYEADFRDYHECCRESIGEHDEYCMSLSARMESQALDKLEDL